MSWFGGKSTRIKPQHDTTKHTTHVHASCIRKVTAFCVHVSGKLQFVYRCIDLHCAPFSYRNAALLKNKSHLASVLPQTKRVNSYKNQFHVSEITCTVVLFLVLGSVLWGLVNENFHYFVIYLWYLYCAIFYARLISRACGIITLVWSWFDNLEPDQKCVT